MKRIDEWIGNTPMVELVKTKELLGLKGNLFVKLEYFNPAGSIKDRVAKAMIDEAEKNGTLKKGGTVIEATSGNTGIGLALVATARGYRSIIVMPDTMSVERQKMIKAYGAEVVLTDGKLGMKGAVEKAEELQKEIKGSIIAGQFDNPVCVQAHYDTTAKEIWQQTDGKTDIFVAGVGTGGTLTGIGKFLKEKDKNIQVVAIEPASSPLLSLGKAGAHAIQGIGANFLPSILDTTIYDEVLTVENEDAYFWARELGKTEGLFVGISSGAAVCAGIALAKKVENEDKNIVVILPDGGSRYLSTPLLD